MTNIATAFASVRGLWVRVAAAALAAFVLAHSSLALAAAPSAPVVAVEQAGVADLVLLGRGFDAGLREGMVCRVTRGSSAIAEILLVELRPACSAALILSVVAGQSIRSGDIANIKVIKS